MIAKHPTSGTEKVILGSRHRQWSFLFGWIYYAGKGMWGPAALSFITANGLFGIMPLWNRSIVRGWYEKQGWSVRDD